MLGHATLKLSRRRWTNFKVQEAFVKQPNLPAYLLIGVGLLFLLSRFSLGSDWLWIAVVSSAFLWAYTRQKRYGLLVAGSILMGIAVGSLIGTWSGFMISLAAGFYAIHRVEPRGGRWPVMTAGILALVGILGWLLDSGSFGSFGFSVLLIGAGAYLLSRNNRKASAPEAVSSPTPQTVSNPAPAPSVSEADPSPTATAPAASPAKASPPAGADPEAAANAAPMSDEEATAQPGKPEADPPEPASDRGLYERLETWRRETAKREDRAAYLILTNASLHEITATKPQTPEELRAVKGIGPVKLERYGNAILEIVVSS